MSMRGTLISKEYQGMSFVRDKDGKEYVCYSKDVQNFDERKGLTKQQREKCLNESQILGDSW